MKKCWKRFQAGFLAAMMSVTVFSAPSVQAGEALPGSQAREAAVPLAEFDFNAEPQDGVFRSGDTVASVVGTAVLTDRDAGNGKALYFDGSAAYLDLKKADGGSLLGGLEEITVSYDAKPDRTSTNWAFYAAPDESAPEYGREVYIGALQNGGNTTAERYHNTGGRPASASAATGADWSHVDIVFTKGATDLYVDGVKKSSEASAYGLKELLGDNSIFQIGKANWGGGEYSKMWIDNFKVYPKALSQEELYEVPSESYRKELLDRHAAKVSEVILDAKKAVLPDYDGTVTWKSGMEAVVIAENGLSATVEQPAAGQAPIKGKLVAVVSLYGLQVEKEVDVTIRPVVGEDDPYGYMMVHFVEDSKGYAEKIYLDISRGDNPEQWDPLNGRKPILASNLSTTGVRDPFLTYSPETETYYILGTDLRVFGGDEAGWGGWQKNYSTKMNIWESKDLITWSPLRQFDVALDQDGVRKGNMGMMWAPEATWVPDYYGEGKGAFVVYWSSTVYSDEAQNNSLGSHIMWGATTDFTQDTWEFGGRFLNGGTAGYIDTTIIQNGDKTYHITKSHVEEIIMESTSDKEWWKEGANWTRIQSEIGKSRFGSVEGPAVFKDHSQENRWYLFVDDLPTPGYQPMISTDLDKGWEYLDSKDYFLTSLTKHGGVISLTKKQYDAVRAADAVSAVNAELGEVTVASGTSPETLRQSLPQTAEVNMAYRMGTSELPVVWDISGVDTAKAGKYQVNGVVQSIGANLDQWVGKNNSTSYLAEDKTLYSSGAIKVTAAVEVKVTSHTVKFQAANGSKDTTVEAISGRPVQKPKDPVRAGYRFEGWFAQGAKQAYDFRTPVTSNLVLTAKWTKLTAISAASVTVAKAVYNGKAQKPKVTVTFQKKKLKQGTDYTISYGTYKKPGQGKVKITGIGAYTGTKTVAYHIKPKANKVKKVTNSKKGKLTVTYTKATGAKRYEIRYSTSSKFKTYKKVTSTKSSATLKGLKKNKTYYIKVRSYVKVGKKAVYSDFSKAVKKKVLK